MSTLDAELLASLVGLSREAVMVRDEQGRIVFWNDGAERLYGWPAREALGRISHELLGTRFPRALALIEKELQEHGQWEGELHHSTRDSREVVVESRWVIRGDVVLEVNHDVTERLAQAAQFRAIFEASLDAVLLTAPDGRILAANPAAEELYGRSEAEIVAGGRELAVDPTDPRVARALAERERTGHVRAQLRILRSDGTPVEVEVSSTVFRTEVGELRTSMIMRDVTERARVLQEARESQARFEALADATSEAVFIHDLGQVLVANRAASAIFGYAQDELVGMNVLEFAAPFERERAKEIISARSEGPYEITGLRADGTTLQVEVAARSIVFEGREARVVTLHDVTERHLARLALEEQNVRLRELDAMKSEFVALVSHELRTPLTSLVAHLDVLARGQAGTFTDRQRRYVETASRNARRLGRLVDDLLFLARAGAGRFALERRRVDPVPLVEQVVDAFQPSADEARVELRAVVEQAPILRADPGRLMQLLDNLVSNALKFTPAGGQVEVRLRPEGGSLLLEVADTGVGIAAAEQQHLFERFYSGGADTAAPGGAGLGLAIVREIATAHGGDVRVESALGRGSTFTVELPLES